MQASFGFNRGKYISLLFCRKGKSISENRFHCVVQPNDVHFWELHFAECVIVAVFGDDVFGLCRHGSIYFSLQMIRTFYDMGKIIFAEKEKVRIFASDFIRKSSKRYIFVLLVET